MSKLRGVTSSAAHELLTPEFRKGQLGQLTLDGYWVELNLKRPIDLGPLQAIMVEAQRRYQDQREKSDAWLAPRVHAALRLTRREASNNLAWNYLNIGEFADYVRWRFEDEQRSKNGVPLDRFLGQNTRNAVGRLWWAAELTRNGKDYAPTVEALAPSRRLFNSWLALDALHHRPAALAIFRFLTKFNEGKGATDPQSLRLARAFNLALATVSLDALSENPAPDLQAIQDWCIEEIDETKMMDDLPIGPDEEPIPEASIQRVEHLLRSLAEAIDLAEVKRVRSKPTAELALAGTTT